MHKKKESFPTEIPVNSESLEPNAYFVAHFI